MVLHAAGQVDTHRILDDAVRQRAGLEAQACNIRVHRSDDANFVVRYIVIISRAGNS